MAKKRHYKKPKKPISKKGLWALCISIGSLAVFAFVLIVSARNAGASDNFLTIISMIAMAENFVGAYLGISGARIEDDGLFFRVAGVIGAVVATAAWVSLYLVGLTRI